MPNFDGGHYYLTALIPIKTEIVLESDGMRRSPVQLLRHALATLPTALQTQATEKIGINSPFARNTRTHLARFVVINDLMYNARDPVDAIKVAVSGINPVVPQPQDSLSCPFLLFVADFDARSGDASELTSYLTTLWATMEEELREVFTHCLGFDAVTSGPSFAQYIARCQLETTMPFNDYWTTSPPLGSLKQTIVRVIIGCGVAGVVLALLLGAGLLAALFWGTLAGLAVGLILAYRLVMSRANQPLPTAPNSDLPSVLKALYLQQKFTQLAIDVQGQGDQDLYSRFAAFVADHRPLDTTDATRTQLPGVIRS